MPYKIVMRLCTYLARLSSSPSYNSGFALVRILTLKLEITIYAVGSIVGDLNLFFLCLSGEGHRFFRDLFRLAVGREGDREILPIRHRRRAWMGSVGVALQASRRKTQRAGGERPRVHQECREILNNLRQFCSCDLGTGNTLFCYLIMYSHKQMEQFYCGERFLCDLLLFFKL